MINSIFGAIINVFLLIVSSISSLIISPLLSLFTLAFPTFTSYITDALYFLSRVINGLNFAKEVILNITGLPRVFFYALVSFFFLKVSIMGVVRSYKFLIRMYYVLRGTRLRSKE